MNRAPYRMTYNKVHFNGKLRRYIKRLARMRVSGVGQPPASSHPKKNDFSYKFPICIRGGKSIRTQRSKKSEFGVVKPPRVIII